MACPYDAMTLVQESAMTNYRVPRHISEQISRPPEGKLGKWRFETEKASRLRVEDES